MRNLHLLVAVVLCCVVNLSCVPALLVEEAAHATLGEVKALAVVSDMTLTNDDELRVFVNIQVPSGTRHFNIELGPYDKDLGKATLLTNLRTAIKDYAEENLDVTFGALDSVWISNEPSLL